MKQQRTDSSLDFAKEVATLTFEQHKEGNNLVRKSEKGVAALLAISDLRLITFPCLPQ
jgi:hypothetical protein